MPPKNPKSRFDVLGLGTVAVDELIITERYPAADAKVRVTHAERQCGGLTAIALIAAARLGGRCAYAGVLGNDEFSQFAVQQLKQEAIDICFLRRRPFSPPVHSFIVIDPAKHTRNVFSHRAVEYNVPVNWPKREVIESARVLFVDHSGLPAMIRAARIARAAGIPVVADLERNSGPRFGELMDLVDHLILSEKFALTFTGTKNVRTALESLWNGKRALVAITRGKRGCSFIEKTSPGKVMQQPAFAVEAVDTTGCGDVFHGAYALALAKGLSAHDRIRFASAAAALKTKRIGAQAGIPTRTAVEKFLRQQKISR